MNESINPQVIFCFPWEVKYFVTLKSEVKAKANYLDEIYPWVVYRMLLKLLDMYVCIVEVFLMKILWNASWRKLFINKIEGVVWQEWWYRCHVSNEGLFHLKRFWFLRFPKPGAEQNSLCLQGWVWDQLSYQSKGRSDFSSHWWVTMHVGDWMLLCLLETELSVAPKVSSGFFCLYPKGHICSMYYHQPDPSMARWQKQCVTTTCIVCTLEGHDFF